jgi:hypothetical protein
MLELASVFFDLSPSSENVSGLQDEGSSFCCFSNVKWASRRSTGTEGAIKKNNTPLELSFAENTFLEISPFAGGRK